MTVFLAGVAAAAAGAALSLVLPGRLKGIVYTVFSGIGLACLTAGAVPVLVSGQEIALALSLPLPFGAVSLALDPLSAFFVLTLALSNFTAGLYSIGYLKQYAAAPQARLYYLGLGVLFSAMLLLVAVRSAVAFLFLWEIMSLASFALVAFEHEKEEARRAAVYYLVAMQAGFAFLLSGFVVLGQAAGSLEFADFGRVLGAPGGLGIGIFLLLFVGFGTKAGFAPFHTWLPKAHPAAPAPVSAVMSGVMIKTGIYGLLRLLLWMGSPPLVLSYGVLFLSVLTALLGVIQAVSHGDLKKVLASSSMENIGLIGAGIGLGMLGRSLGLPFMSFLGFAAAVFHVFNHSLFKSLLFMGAGSVYTATHTRDMEKLGGLGRAMPVTSALFLLGSLALSGLPLFNGFSSEFALYLSALRGLERPEAAQGLALALSLGALSLVGVLALFCFVRAYSLTFLGLPRADLPHQPQEKSLPMLVAQLIPAALILLLGLFPVLALPFLTPLAGGLAGVEASSFAPALAALYAPLSAGLHVFLAAAGGLFLARTLLLRKNKIAQAKTWDCGYQRPSARLQYTPGSFSGIVRGFFSPLLGLKTTVRTAAPVSGGKGRVTGASTETRDPVDAFAVRPAAAGLKKFFALFLRVQSGATQQYILYGVAFLVAVIVIIFGLGG